MVDFVICRLCLESERPVYNIFSYNLKERDTRAKILKCVYLDITEHDTISTSICVGCINKIEEITIYSEQVEKNQQVFKQYLEKAAAEESNHDTYDTSASNYEVFEIDEDSSDDVELSVEEPGTSRQRQVKSFTCEICGKILSSKWSHEYHLTTHNEVRQSQCEICGKWLKNNFCLTKHMEIHSDIRFKCTQCSYSTCHRDKFLLHIRGNHSTTATKHTCRDCNRVFSKRSYLENHINRQACVKKFICEYCDKVFAYRSNYFMHRKTEHADILGKVPEEEDEGQRTLEDTQQSSGHE